MTHRVLGCDLALAEGRVRELPAAGDVTGGIDVRHHGAHVVVGRDRRSVGRDPHGLQPEVVDERGAADRDEHQVALDGLALAEVHDQVLTVVVDLRALLPELERDPAPLERLGELLRGVLVLLRDQGRASRRSSPRSRSG